MKKKYGLFRKGDYVPIIILDDKEDAERIKGDKDYVEIREVIE